MNSLDPFLFFDFSGLVKLFLLVLTVFYFVFTIVVYRQIDLMTQIISSQISPLVKSIALLQIISVVALFIIVVGLT